MFEYHNSLTNSGDSILINRKKIKQPTLTDKELAIKVTLLTIINLMILII